MIDTKALMTCFEFFSKIFVRSSRASKQQQKLFGDFTDTQEILGRISTELQAMKELTETLYSTAQKLGGVVDYAVTEGKPGPWGPESQSLAILFHCILKYLETRQPESECKSTLSEPASNLAPNNEEKG